MESAGSSIGSWLVPLALAAGLFAWLIFTLVAIVLACIRRTRGWIAAAILSSVLSFAGLSFGAIAGLKAIRDASAGPASTTMVSEDGWISVEVPRRWSTLASLHEDANLKVGDPAAEEYMIVLSEPIAGSDGTTLETFATTARAALLEGLQNGQAGAVQPLTIHGYPALRCRLTGSTSGIAVCYLHTSLQTPDGFHQIVQWTMPAREAAVRPIFEQIAASFRVVGPQPAVVSTPEIRKPHPGTPEERVRALIAEQFGRPADEVQPSTRLKEDLQADDLDLVEIVIAVEEEFGIELTDDEAAGVATVADLTRYAQERAKQP